ncbi:hypothetical protein [Cellulomonas sp. Marseille-Q8402]
MTSLDGATRLAGTLGLGYLTVVRATTRAGLLGRLSAPQPAGTTR